MLDVLKQAIDYIENVPDDRDNVGHIDRKALVLSLNQSIKEWESQEPDAWRYALDASIEGPRWIYIDKDPHQWLLGPAMTMAVIEKLYAHPPQRTWVGLTTDEIAVIHANYPNPQGFALALQAKLKEKNND